MEQRLYPVCCAYMLSQSDESLSFRTLSGKICKFRSNIMLILSLIQKCTGIMPADALAHAVSEETGISVSVIEDAIDDLMNCEILIDSHEQLLQYHFLTFNPPKYLPTLSFEEIDKLTKTRPNYAAKAPIAAFRVKKPVSLSICDTLKERYSCRDFLNVPVELEKLFVMCKVSYSRWMSPVASAGALFPLSVYFINRISQEQLPAGLYQYDPLKEELLLLATEISEEAIQYSLNDATAVFGAPCIFFICADIQRHVKKYANRGYRYSLLEAGHVVQNMTIAAIEMGLGGVEYGGFYDEAVKELFNMEEVVFPLACYAIGYEDAEGKNTKEFLQKEREKRIIESLVNKKEVSINPFLIDDARFRLSNLQVIVSKFQDAQGHEEFGTGVASTYGEAYVKSVMEVCERYVLSKRYFDKKGCTSKLEGKYLSPQQYAPYSNNQIKEGGFANFQLDDPVEWLQGYDLNENPVYIPADLCFDVMGNTHTPYHIANTSGCAAHFDYKMAEKIALLELIERDAIMKNWLYQKTPSRISEGDLPDNIAERLGRYQEKGNSIFILSLPCEYAFTVLVCSVNNDAPPYFVSGASSSFLSVTDAIVKAFNEWEVSYVLETSKKDLEVIVPEEVIFPKDHGRLYRNTNYNEKIDYLLHGRSIGIDEVYAKRLGNIEELFPTFFSYRPLVENICVVRAFSKELIPINFGYGMDFFSHSKIETQLLKISKFPHFFA